MSKRLRRGCDLKSLSSNSSYFIGRVISDLKSASLCKKDVVEVPFSNFVLKFITFLYSKGFITRFFIIKKKKKTFIYIILRYFKNYSFLHNISLKSTASRSLTLTYKQLFYKTKKTSIFWGGLGIFSTKYGILDMNQCVRFRTGGVFLCFIPYLLFFFTL